MTEKKQGRPKRADGKNALSMAKMKYNDKAYDRINLTIAKGNKDIIKARAADAGKSVNGYINALIAADIPEYKTLDG